MCGKDIHNYSFLANLGLLKCYDKNRNTKVNRCTNVSFWEIFNLEGMSLTRRLCFRWIDAVLGHNKETMRTLVKLELPIIIREMLVMFWLPQAEIYIKVKW